MHSDDDDNVLQIVEDCRCVAGEPFHRQREAFQAELARIRDASNKNELRLLAQMQSLREAHARQIESLHRAAEDNDTIIAFMHEQIRTCTAARERAELSKLKAEEAVTIATRERDELRILLEEHLSTIASVHETHRLELQAAEQRGALTRTSLQDTTQPHPPIVIRQTRRKSYMQQY